MKENREGSRGEPGQESVLYSDDTNPNRTVAAPKLAVFLGRQHMVCSICAV